MRGFIIVFFALGLCFLESVTLAQPIPRMDSVRVQENSVWLRNPTAGGFNLPEFSQLDLDGDGTMDLVVFDRSGKKIIPFRNNGTAGQADYTFAPEYAAAFPSGISDFLLCRDFDCDGKNDLFFAKANFIHVYRNTSTSGNLSFQLFTDTLLTDYGAGPAIVYISLGDIPDFVDVDGDGDLDMLTFDAAGTHVEWHKNLALENTGYCGLQFIAADRCWGKFQESGVSQAITLGVSCRMAPVNPELSDFLNVHTGSTIAAFDEDDDGDYEVVLGDLLYDGLTYLRNGGSPANANMDTVDATFPSYDSPVSINLFVAAFFLDVDNDGKKDMIAAPNGQNISINYDNAWFYKNIASGSGVELSRVRKNFLQEEMIDVGLGAYPVFFDYDGDGLLDLMIGNYSRKLSLSNVTSGLSLYRNTGTASQPEFQLVDRNFAGLSTIFNPSILGVTPALGDLDGDGDKDMIIGDADGRLHYLENIAPTGQPSAFVLRQQNYKGIDIGQFATPFIADIDRDGKNDLIVGEMSGSLNYFRNIGTAQVADFNANPDDDAWGNVDTQPTCCSGFSIPFIFTNPQSGRYDLLVGSEDGPVLYFGDFESQLGGAFTLDNADFGEFREGQRTAIAGADLTGDGIWEWAVGNVRGGIGFYSGNGPMTSIAPGNFGVEAFDILPNPSSGMLNIRLRGQGGRNAQVSILDVQGSVKSSFAINNSGESHSADLSELPAGLYFVSVSVNGEPQGMRKWVLLR